MNLLDSIKGYGVYICSSIDTQTLITLLTNMPVVLNSFPEVARALDTLQSYYENLLKAQETLQKAKDFVIEKQTMLQNVKDLYDFYLNTPGAYISETPPSPGPCVPGPVIVTGYTAITSAQKVLAQAEAALEKAQAKVDTIKSKIDTYKEDFVNNLLNLQV